MGNLISKGQKLKRLGSSFFKKYASAQHFSDQTVPLLPEVPDSGLRLNIGGGKGHPKNKNWKIVDLRSSADIVLNIAEQPLPFPDNSVEVILTSHTLEHIYPQQLKFVLNEMHRVLKPGGILRVVVPDIEKAIKAYANNDYLFFERSSIGQFDKSAPIGGLLASWFYSTRIFADAQLKHGEGHVHCFDHNYMAYWLKLVGFKKVWRSSFQGSALNELREPGFDLHEQDSLYIEAIK